MTEKIDCAVVGGGVIGLAVGRALALAGHEVIVLEAEGVIGSGISSRSSEVIHAGMYYPSASRKARFCVDGNRLLRTYLRDRRVPHRLLGKLIVAVDAAEEEQLQAIFDKGRANGVDGLEPLTGRQAAAMEPALACRSALFSPSTGIVDSHALMLALAADLEENGGVIALKSPVEGAEVTGDGLLLTVGGQDPTRLACKRMVNAAGLGAQRLAAAISGLPPARVPPSFLCKGNYFLLSGRLPFTRLVYPIPESAGIGIHYTLDMAGQARFGPDVEWTGEAGYAVDPARADTFYAR
ncbi:MAG TPA: FAD-dependent oxidoreductase, partial [Rhodospirillaceae bacterium]|nr:FAD-dependent oxidoreductase [Rhodospirillaceae bacterium]